MKNNSSKAKSSGHFTRSGQEILIDPSGFFHLNDSNQLKALHPSLKELGSYTHLDFAGRKVMDLGACAGSFNRLAAQSGASYYVGIEPDEDNFDCLLLNNKFPEGSYSLHNAAAIRGQDPFVEFLVLESGDKLSGEIKRPESITKGRIVKKVPAIDFHALIEAEKPDILKCDVEGAEFELIDRKLPDSVCQVVLEIHVFNKAERLNALWYTIFGKVFANDMWSCNLQPVWTHHGFCTFHGFNIMQMGFTRPWDWRERDMKNRHRSCDRQLQKKLGTQDLSNPEALKMAIDFLKGEPADYLEVYLKERV